MMQPFHRVSKGDIIILKKSGGDIVGVFEAKDIHYFELKSEEDIKTIKSQYNHQLCCSNEFWNSKMESHYATLIDVGKLMILTPIKVSFKNRLSWISGKEMESYPTIICISGEIASEKTYITKRIAEILQNLQYSVSDYLKMIAAERDIQNVSRKVLQEIGKE